MTELLEAAMIICFGISWPLNIVKSLKSRTAKGRSLLFMCFILVGYFCGIMSKIASGKITYVFIFYILNFAMVAFDMVLYFKNTKLDKAKDKILSEEKTNG